MAPQDTKSTSTLGVEEKSTPLSTPTSTITTTSANPNIPAVSGTGLVVVSIDSITPLGTPTLSSATVSVPSNGSNSSTALPTKSTITKNGLSGGAVAGVAIGCLLAGAALATLICFLLFRRKGKNQPAAYSQQGAPYQDRTLGPEKGAVVVAGTVAGSIDHLLPQPVEDDAIIKEVSRIRDNIKNHAQTYYHFEPVPEVQVNGQALAEIAEATGMSSSTLVRLLSNPSTRGDAIRLVISYVALSRCEDSRFPSLLPQELASLAIAIPRNDGNKTALFSKWKTITGALLQSRYGRQGQTSGVPSQGVSNAIAALNSALAPFVQGSLDGGQRHKNLELIFGRAEGLAFLLFSQPSSFRFDFTGQRALVVFPALLQVINEQAQALSPPRVFWEKEAADVNI